MATVRFGGGAKVEKTATSGSSSAADFVEIENVKGDIQYPGGQAARIEVQNHTTIRLQGRKKLYTAGLTDTSNLKFMIHYDCDDTGHKALLAAQEAGTKFVYRITPGEGNTKVTVYGAIGNFQRTDPENEIVKCDFEVFPEVVVNNA